MVDALIVGAEIGRFEDGDQKDLVRSMNANRSAPSSYVAISRGTSGYVVRRHLPDENAECFLVTHMHQQRADDKAKALAVSNLFIVETKAFEHPTKHLLAVS